MNTTFGIRTRRVVLVAATLAILTSALAIHIGFVQGKASIIPAAGTTPVVGATVTLTSRRGNPNHEPIVASATTDAQGNFTLALAHGGAFLIGGYTFSIAPGMVFTTSGKSTTPTPFQAWVTFTPGPGIVVNKNVVVPKSPISIQTNATLIVGTKVTTTTQFVGTLTR